MNTETIEKIYKTFEKSIEILKEELGVDFLDAFIETGDNLISGQIHVEDGKPSEAIIGELKKIYEGFKYNDYSPEELRKAIQLVMIRANKEERIQANHQFTPEAIGMLFNYIIENLKVDSNQLTIFDPAVGTGNLLSTILNYFQTKRINFKGIGVDNDDTMLSIASMSFAFERLEVELFHQDSIDDLFVKNVDIAVSDLPVGYYPIDERTKGFETRSKEGHSFVHHLLIEQSMKTIRPGGYGVFLVPSNLFQTQEAKKLLSFFHEKVYLQVILNLPTKMFKDEQAQKSILILQKVGASAKQAEQVLLGEFPEFNNQEKMLDFLQDFKKWAQKNLF
ncbi:class I SAM-dependent methyltransferase [Pediococcus pentosaceus]|uniref:class I SAM-dependent methyltransferase n=1 Tax=Pediococcus pentosaceus TaxID=1255 RepID=UPI00259AF416|nr:class I SAM-dependent methyltransferase [Pediococcus pentosaceus]WFC00799.1 class I SAM-dependent methyltransferase [Pediococcus pentosaceus]